MDAVFNRYYTEDRIDSMPVDSGVYIVYRGKQTSPGKFQPKKIIYIGQATNIKERIKKHNKYDEFNRSLQKGEQLYFSCALVSQIAELYALENALICSEKPVLNDEFVDNFDREISNFNISGACALVTPHEWSIEEPFRITVTKS